ncbi:MAG: Kelch repeat-containing protein [Opitutaceae bacterium]
MSPAACAWLRDQHASRLHRQTGDRFRWERIRPAVESKVEPGAAVAGTELFIISGYRTLAQVSNLIEIFDLERECWKTPLALPEHFPNSHHGLCSDGTRYLYLAGGQIGPQSGPCTAKAQVFDAVKRTWSPLPPLPQPRYAPIAELLDGRLHIVAGAMPDRYTHADEHWSLRVADGRALESAWRVEPPIPHGGHHRASAVVDGQLYSLGGQERDVRPIPGDPNFTCDWSTPDEILYADVFAYCPRQRAWRTCAPMPEMASHAEFSSFAQGRFIWIFGGIADRRTLKSAIQAYDIRTDRWKVVGRHPYPIKGHVAVAHAGNVFSFCGQRSVSPGNLFPGDVLASGWKARLPDLEALFEAERPQGRG